ncbi:tripartite tricarboxylate transporter substrate binding protein [Acidovorax sp. Be4]|uniref:Tripartite tricarboxylate transporter substrate binding protein n=1 Tax=Acidovorax bellezanensis TaxID=2976702 RepID=A0ABT2PIA9_9BURK|nr:tripartite tricarboxylate transporter substrate binding protein [Acidovorax sp. Be4]MCT9810225.1 tripartite tricarboxylate transporter substrate binding protein [Acidovorax sp. Be4]
MKSQKQANAARRQGLKALSALGLCAMAWTTPVMAQSWPEKPVRLVVNFAPGGAADVLARAILPQLSQTLGQPVVIENKPGAGGNIGIAETVRASKDGYTLLLSSGGAITINPMIYGKLPYDPARDLTPVAAMARIHVYLETHPSVPAKNVAEFIQYLKANPGKISYGSPGQGSSPHLAGEMFKRMAGVDAVHAPYRGAAPALNDVVSGQLQYWFDPGPGLKHVDAGKLRLLAVGSPKRSPQYPNVPTLAESGLPGFDADTLFGIYAPTGVPDAVVAKVRDGIARALEQKAVLDIIASLGATPAAMTRKQFVDHHAIERERFADLVASIGLKAE